MSSGVVIVPSSYSPVHDTHEYGELGLSASQSPKPATSSTVIAFMIERSCKTNERDYRRNLVLDIENPQSAGLCASRARLSPSNERNWCIAFVEMTSSIDVDHLSRHEIGLQQVHDRLRDVARVPMLL